MNREDSRSLVHTVLVYIVWNDSMKKAYFLMPVYYGFAQCSYGEETVHTGCASVKPKISPEKSSISFAHGESKLFKKKNNIGATSW